ncbi:MAG: hypothetical protein JWL80_311 [Parcubacteria group bacterium]|nr:hypothetical protein [Parcubacteria group bacterium]
MKKPLSHVLGFLVLVILVVPVFIHAQEIAPDKTSLIVCNGTTAYPCTIDSLILLVHNAINFLIKLSTILAAAVFAFAGFKLLTSGGDEGAMKDAKKMLLMVLKGYVIVVLAWFLIYTITNALLDPAGGFSLLGNPSN